jgi:hypothetical protein
MIQQQQPTKKHVGVENTYLGRSDKTIQKPSAGERNVECSDDRKRTAIHENRRLQRVNAVK